MSFRLKPATRPWFLTPVNLVPNGRAHLGHIAGPLLKMDILARHLRRRGDQVSLISSSDVHETHVLVRAQQEGRSPAEVANDYHQQVANDLAALDIRYDAFLNPLDAEWQEPYQRLNVELVDALVAAGVTRVEREKFAWGRDSQDWVIGGFLAGSCPRCGTRGVSFFCEACGNHFQPQDVVDPAPRLCNEALEWREDASLFLSLPDSTALLRRFDQMALRPDFRAIVSNYISREGARIRLTLPGQWGVPYPVPGSATPHCIFTYSGVLFGCHLLCGEAWGRLTGRGINAFAPDSDARTVISFGIDNAIPFIVGVLGCGIGQDRFRPVDDYLVNYFYSLEGAKFSTNRRHVIWGGDLTGKTPLESDLARLYLASVNPEFATADFQLEDCLEQTNRWRCDLLAATDPGLIPPGIVIGTPPAPLLALLDELLGRQDRALDPACFALVDVVAPLQAWLDRRTAFAPLPSDQYWWRKGLALLAAPLLPQMAERLWREAGMAGQPSLAEYLEIGAIRMADQPLWSATPLTRQDLKPCLPASLS